MNKRAIKCNISKVRHLTMALTMLIIFMVGASYTPTTASGLTAASENSEANQLSWNEDSGISSTEKPVIDVNPSSLSSNQVPGDVKTQILTIGNLGNADLEWFIDEAPTLAASVPAAVPAVGSSAGSAVAPDPGITQDDGLVNSPSAQTLSAWAGFTPSTAPLSPRNVGSHGLLVNDGSFENGPPPASAWTETTNNACEWIGDWTGVWGAAAYDGVFDYWGGGYCSGAPSTDSVEQAIMVPAGGQLSFWYMAYRTDADDAAVDTAYVSVAGTEVWALELIQANNTYPNWVNATIDLSAYAGQTVNLKLGANSSGDLTGNIRFDFVEFLSDVCALPDDIPWLSLAPDAGTTHPASSTDVEVTTDATGLAPGLYEANLCVNSNDPESPLVVVPMAMTVLEEVNAWLNLDDLGTFYDRNPAPGAPAGVYTIQATFSNISSANIEDIVFQVVELTGGNLLLNADGGPGGAGSTLSILPASLGGDGVLEPGEAFTQDYEIGLQVRRSFTFFVDAYGNPIRVSSNAPTSASSSTGFHFEVSNTDLGVSELFLPALSR